MAEMTKGDREGVLVYRGHDSVCRKRAQKVLEEHKLPLGILHLEDIQEFGFNKSSGFMWLVQKNKTEHYFDEIDELVSYGIEVSAYVEEGRMKNVRGIKARELAVWFPIKDLNVGGGNLFIKTFANITKAFPMTTFQEPAKSVTGPGNRQQLSSWPV